MFTQRGGARLDWCNATWPFAKLSVGADALRLKVFQNCYEFPSGSIDKLRPYRGVTGLGLTIEHTIVDRRTPWLVIFWTFDYGRLQAGLEEAGYQVLDRAHELKWWRDRVWHRPRPG
jgi:hypothetical protein